MYSVSLPQAAVLLGVSWPRAHNLLTRGELGPSSQLAGRWLLTQLGIEAYLERTKSAAEPTLPTPHAGSSTPS